MKRLGIRWEGMIPFLLHAPDDGGEDDTDGGDDEKEGECENRTEKEVRD